MSETDKKLLTEIYEAVKEEHFSLMKGVLPTSEIERILQSRFTFEEFEIINDLSQELPIIKSQEFQNLGLLYEKKKQQSNNPIQYNHLYNIYQLKKAQGTHPIFLITGKFVRLPIGKNRLYVKHDRNLLVEDPEDSAKSILCGLHGLKEKTSKKNTVKLADIWNDLLQKNQKEPVFVYFTSPIAENELKTIIDTWDNQNFIDLFLKYMKGDGYSTDPTIEYVYRADLIPSTLGDIEPQRMMRFSPHKISVTNTKTRKTTLGFLLGTVMDRVTAANFLGFATANDVNPGYGDGQISPIYFDEVDQLSKIFVDHIFNYMEIGKTQVNVGKASVVTSGWSTLTFHANPKAKGNNPTDLMKAFSSLLQSFSEKVDGLGSRIGCVLFGNDFQVYKREQFISQEEKDKSKLIIDAIIQELVPKMEKIITDENIQKWLSEELPNYKNQVNNLLAKNPNLPDNIKRFWESQTNSFTHMKGFALKQVVFEHVTDILHDSINIEDLLDASEEHLNKLTEVNLGSLNKMCQLGFSQQEEIENYLSSLKVYLKGLVIGCIFALKSNSSAVKENKALVLPEISQAYIKVFDKLPEKFKLPDIYRYFSRIEGNLNNRQKINKKLLSFGIELYEEKGITVVRPLENWDKLIALTLSLTSYNNDLEELNQKQINKIELEKRFPQEMIDY